MERQHRDEPAGDVRVRRVLPATRERTWHAWTRPDEFAAWVWPPSFASHASMDVAVGGRFHLTSAAAGIGVSGTYLAVEEPTRLVFTWCWDGEDDSTTVTVTLGGLGSGTELNLRHEGFTSPQARDDHERGWTDCLERLPGLLAGG